ncbi:hypothetical protein [Serinicoccus marinus]|uniref:hypothetical protein n=1 Tax=Serinicoccus marinus TaxID=247333 RepID=UPI000485DE9A|nr:hypothetical protein [Serinicoccus marinus]
MAAQPVQQDPHDGSQDSSRWLSTAATDELLATAEPGLQGTAGLSPDACLDGIEALQVLAGRLEQARIHLTAQLAARTGEELLARSDVADPEELSTTARDRWRARTKSVTALEVATLTGLGRGRARQLVALVLAPRAVSAPVREGLRRGVASWSQIEHFWRLSAGLPHEHAADVARSLFSTSAEADQVCLERLDSGGGVADRPWGAKQFVQALQREVTRARSRDPEAEAQARADRHRGRTAFGIVDDDGTGQVVLTGDAASTTACLDRLHQMAHRARAAGDPRTEAQLRSDLGRALLLHGTLPLGHTDDRPSDAAIHHAAMSDGGRSEVDLAHLLTPDDVADLARVISGSPTYQLQVVVPWDSLAGGTSPPQDDQHRATGSTPGVGRVIGRSSCFVPSEEIARMVGSAGTTLHRLLVDPADGRCVERSIARYKPDAAMRRQVAAADLVSRAPDGTLPSGDGQLDHVTEHRLGGPTSEPNLQSLDTVFHAMKTQKFWAAQIDETRTVTWTSFFDRLYRTRSHDYRQYLSGRSPRPRPSDDTGSAERPPPASPDTSTPLSAQAQRHLASVLVYAALCHRKAGGPLEAADDDPGGDDPGGDTLGGDDRSTEAFRAVWVRHTRARDGRRVTGPHPSTPDPDTLLGTEPRAILRAEHWTDAFTPDAGESALRADEAGTAQDDGPPPF